MLPIPLGGYCWTRRRVAQPHSSPAGADGGLLARSWTVGSASSASMAASSRAAPARLRHLRPGAACWSARACSMRRAARTCSPWSSGVAGAGVDRATVVDGGGEHVDARAWPRRHVHHRVCRYWNDVAPVIRRASGRSRSPRWTVRARSTRSGARGRSTRTNVHAATARARRARRCARERSPPRRLRWHELSRLRGSREDPFFFEVAPAALGRGGSERRDGRSPGGSPRRARWCGAPRAPTSSGSRSVEAGGALAEGLRGGVQRGHAPGGSARRGDAARRRDAPAPCRAEPARRRRLAPYGTGVREPAAHPRVAASAPAVVVAGAGPPDGADRHARRRSPGRPGLGRAHVRRPLHTAANG